MKITSLWGEIVERIPSPVVELNRCVAVVLGGLRIVDALVGNPTHEGYNLLPGLRGILLFKLGRVDETSLARNAREKTFLMGRASECAEQ